MRGFKPVLAAAFLALAAGALAAAPRLLELDTQSTWIELRFGATLQTVRGRLGPIAGTLSFDDQRGNPASGEVVIDLLQAETGVARRDRKMHAKILETGRYPRAVFRLERLDLPEPLREGQNTVQLHGALEFHGATHPLSLTALATVRGDRLTAKGSVVIPYIAWGLDDPSYFLLRVAKEVRAEVSVGGRLRLPLAAAGPARPRR